jgi:glutathione S-transferase
VHSFEIYWSPGTCARATLIALEEVGAEVTERIPRDWHHNPEYLAVNPKGRVPTLFVDGEKFTETPAILSLLSRLYPESNLLPTGSPVIETRALSLMNFFSSGLHPLIGRARFAQNINDAPASQARISEIAVGHLLSYFQILEDRLAQRGSGWLFDEWSVVDGYLLWMFFRAFGTFPERARFPHIEDMAQRCQQRPSVSRALDREEAAYARLYADGLVPDPQPAPGRLGRLTPLV